MLEFRGLEKTFGSVRALAGVSFAVAPGQMYGFVGANGAGKTTAMRIALGVLLADAGEVRWDGRAVDHDVRRRFGYMPEERGLYPKMKVGSQLVYLARLHGIPRAAAETRTAELLARMGLTDRSDDTLEKLSLGNQQRVQLAAALVHEPDVLVLDEPFSGLDPVAVDALSQTLRDQCARGVPVLFSSHQLELVERLCDAVAIINRGRVVADGSVSALRRRDPRRRFVVDVRTADDRVVDLTPLASELAMTVSPPDGPEESGQFVTLSADADDQVLLAAAQRLGRVRAFHPAEPTLAEIYREAVAG